MHKVDLIKRKPQANPSWGPFYWISDVYYSHVTVMKDGGTVPDKRRLKRQDNWVNAWSEIAVVIKGITGIIGKVPQGLYNRWEYGTSVNFLTLIIVPPLDKKYTPKYLGVKGRYVCNLQWNNSEKNHKERERKKDRIKQK